MRAQHTRMAVCRSAAGLRVGRLFAQLHSDSRTTCTSRHGGVRIHGRLSSSAVMASTSAGSSTCPACRRRPSRCDCTAAAWEEGDPEGVWARRLAALRTANAKQVATVLDRRDPIGWVHGKRGWVVDFTRKVAAQNPTDVILVRVGDFYEAHGLSAVMLIEHGNLNAMGGWKSRAGMPNENIQKTLDDLIRAGLTVTVCEEREPARGTKKERFVADRITTHNPQYLFNSLARENDGTIPTDAVPFVGITRDTAGAMRIVKVDTDNRTVGVSAPCSIHAEIDCYIDPRISMLFVGKGQVIPREVAPGVQRRSLSAKDTPEFVAAVVAAVCTECPGFVPLDFRSDPLAARRLLHATTATELGVAENRPGVEPLVDYLAIGSAPPPVRSWYKRLLNNPPSADVREAVRMLCDYLLDDDAEAHPQFVTPHLGNIVRSLRAREATPRLLSQIRDAAAQVMSVMQQLDPQVIGWMSVVVEDSARVGPLSVIDLAKAVDRIDMSLEPECSSSHDHIAVDEDDAMDEDDATESHRHHSFSLNGLDLEPSVQILARKREILLRRARGVNMDAVEAARSALNTVVAARLTPEQREACLYEYRTQSIAVAGNKPLGGAGPWVLLKARSGKDIPKRYTNPMLAAANDEYRDACDIAERDALEKFREVCDDLHGPHFRAVVFAVHFCQVFEALRLHADAAKVKGWCVSAACVNHFPDLDETSSDEALQLQQDICGDSDDSTLVPSGTIDGHFTTDHCHKHAGNNLPVLLSLKAVTPYWMSREEAVPNDFVTDGMALLTAANMSGKSTLLRTVTAACLLANCGLCVPADSAVVPVFDVIFLRNTAYDAPKEGKSSFGVEMSDIRDLLDVVTPRSLVMVDELGKGTSSSEGAALSGAILEHFGSIGCYGVFASHLFELFELPIEVGNLELLTMEVIVHSSACVNEGQSKHIDPTGGSSARSTTGATVGYRRSVEWTYRVKAGQADSSLALDAARHFDVPASIIDRAHALLATSETMRQRSEGIPTAYAAQPSLYADAATSMDRSITCADENSDAVNREQHSDLDYSDLVVTELSRLRGSDGHRVKSVLPQWLPPPRDRMLSVVYALRLPAPDGRWYVGESDDVSERIQEHRRSLAKRNAIFHYVVMPNKSEATRAEAELITTLLNCGVPLLSSRDAGRKRTSASRE